MKHSLAESRGAPQKVNSVAPSDDRPGILEQLFADQVWTENYRVTAEERESLSHTALMGEVTCERDVLFMLNQLRRARLRW